MLDSGKARLSVTAPLNFAAERADGGIWSNGDPSLITQTLQAEEVEIYDGRRLETPPTLAREGFQLRQLALDGYAWTDDEWVAEVYVPRSLDLVRSLTGASHVACFYGRGVLIRDTGNAQRARAAEFVHLDNTRESALPFLEMAVDQTIRRRYPRVKMFNVWRAITPPPQDMPLALCDQRTLSERDWVAGRTIEPTFPDGVPYVTSVFNPAQKWHYFSDLDEDDVVVFKGYDNDPAAPFGCLHGAFKQPGPKGAVPRASAEFRAFALFES